MNTIIEKIKAEVERRMRICERVRGEGGENQDYYHGKAVSYNETLTFLSNIEKEEKPINPNEDVFKIWGTTEEEYLAKSLDKVHLEMEIATYLKDWEDDEEIGLHLSTDNGCITIELDDIRDLARHFAQWQKEQDEKELSEKIASAYQLGLADKEKQMMKEAVEGRVVDAGIFATYNTPVEYTHSGDKVKIIIVKEDKK